MKNGLFRFLGSLFTVLAGVAAAVAAFKLAVGAFGFDAVLNVASNCGPESAAGGAGAGAGSAACGDDGSQSGSGLYGPNTVADGRDLGVNSVGPGRSSAYDTYNTYRDSKQNRPEKVPPQSEPNPMDMPGESHLDTGAGSGKTKSGKAPVEVKFIDLDEKQEQV